MLICFKTIYVGHTYNNIITWINTNPECYTEDLNVFVRIQRVGVYTVYGRFDLHPTMNWGAIMKGLSKNHNLLNDILIVNTRVLYYQCYGRLIHGHTVESIEAYNWLYVEKVYYQCVKEIDGRQRMEKFKYSLFVWLFVKKPEKNNNTCNSTTISCSWKSHFRIPMKWFYCRIYEIHNTHLNTQTKEKIHNTHVNAQTCPQNE